MLKIDKLHSYYGPVEALKDVSLTIEDNSICCVIGSNGAGKTTLLNSISGILHTSGSIKWDISEISKMSPRRISMLGIGHVPEGRHVFPGLTVYENLQVGTVSWRKLVGKVNDTHDLEIVYQIFPRLKERAEQKAWSLSGGEQQMLAIGRALMGRPKLLMLDEPSMGLAPLVVNEMFDAILKIKEQNSISLLLVEQNAQLALEISDYAYVLEQGKIVLEGDAKSLRNDTRIRKAYLGKYA